MNRRTVAGIEHPSWGKEDVDQGISMHEAVSGRCNEFVTFTSLMDSTQSQISTSCGVDKAIAKELQVSFRTYCVGHHEKSDPFLSFL